MDLGIIGGADGPTTILVSANASELAWTLAILAVAAAAARRAIAASFSAAAALAFAIWRKKRKS